MMFKIGSLFSGIGGLELGLERSGLGRVIWQAENDPYCLKILAKHWPDVRRYTDVKDIDGTTERPDLICGGFPCQPFSTAGKRKGEADERNMWPETIRVIRLLGPRFVLLENVPALLTYEYMGQILGDLAKSGYDTEWDCIPAAAVGANHQRDRLFVVAYSRRDGIRNEPGRLNGASGQGATIFADDGAEGNMANTNSRRQQECPKLDSEAEQDSTNRDSWGRYANRRGNKMAHDQKHGRGTGRARGFTTGGTGEPEQTFQDVAHAQNTDGRRTDGTQNERRRNTEVRGRGLGRNWSEYWRIEPDVGRVADGIPARVDRLRALGNAVVPQVAEYIGKQILAAL